MEIATITSYVDPWDGSVRFISFEVWSGEDLYRVVEIRPIAAHQALEMSADFAGTCKSLGDTGGYHAV